MGGASCLTPREMSSPAHSARFNARPPFSFDLPQDPLLSPSAVRDQLRFQQRVAALGSKPARDLTQEEARDLTAYHALTGQITLEKQVTFDPYGKPAFPKPNEKVKLGVTIAGVSFVPANADPAKWPVTYPAGHAASRPPRPSFAIFELEPLGRDNHLLGRVRDRGQRPAGPAWERLCAGLSRRGYAPWQIHGPARLVEPTNHSSKRKASAAQ